MDIALDKYRWSPKWELLVIVFCIWSSMFDDGYLKNTYLSREGQGGGAGVPPFLSFILDFFCFLFWCYSDARCFFPCAIEDAITVCNNVLWVVTIYNRILPVIHPKTIEFFTVIFLFSIGCNDFWNINLDSIFYSN